MNTLTQDSAAAVGASETKLPRRVALSLKFTLAFIGLVSFVLIVNGAVSFWLSYDEAKRSAVRVQQEKAQAAADRIDQFIAEIEQQMGWTTHAEWARTPLDQRRYDFIRLLRQAPAITELIQVDGDGREQLKLSRLEPESVGSGVDYSKDERFAKAIASKTWFGPVYFRRGSEPYITIAIAHAGRKPGVTIAEVNLKFIWDVVTQIRIGEAGHAFITDEHGLLVAHPDMSLVLRRTTLEHLPQVASALANPHPGVLANTGKTTSAFDGSSVLSAYAAIPRLNWIMFVQLPTREALTPVYASLAQTGALLGLGLLLATIVGGLLARRMVVPIRRLQQGAEKLGQGDLSQRIAIGTRDEIGILAERFNLMASRIQESHDTLESKVEERTKALAQSLAELRSTQDRLIQTEKLASLGQLTAGIAHEIKNPLNFVNNFSALSGELIDELNDLLKDASLDAGTREEIDELTLMLKGNLEKVVQHGRRADSIVKNMLLHSREGSGEHRPADINAIVEESLNLAYHGARAEKSGFNIKLERELDPAAGLVDVYPQEITRVFLNLISNGFYAATKRKETSDEIFEPTLKASTKSLGNGVEIRIRDNGTGIPLEVKERMFNPFFTTKPAGEGTGLGLSMSHDIVVKQHRGKIDVATEPGAFTEFIITLPRRHK
jgi:two-component system NtrC family sensor kinase